MEDMIKSIETAMTGVDKGEAGYLWVSRSHYDNKDRAIFAWKVFATDTTVIGQSEDMHSGVAGMGDSPVDMTKAFVSFLLAVAEATEGSDNYDLFDSEVRNWAQYNSQELQDLASDFEDESNQTIWLDHSYYFPGTYGRASLPNKPD